MAMHHQLRSAAISRVYDGISRAALAYGMTETMREQLVKMLATDVDLQARLSQSDNIDAFFSLPDDPERAKSIRNCFLFQPPSAAQHENLSLSGAGRGRRLFQ